MSLPVFVVADLNRPVGSVVEVSGAEGRHAVTVKRIRVGERIELVDAAGTRAQATVTASPAKDRLQARLDALAVEEPPSPLVTVVQAIPKGPHAELAVDLLTQAGADRIVVWQADRCVSKWIGGSSEAWPVTAAGPAADAGATQAKKAAKALAKWRERALQAGKQSQRARLPEVVGPITTEGLALWLGGLGAESVAVVLHEDASRSIRSLPLAAAEEVVLVVGPEGGIGAAELERLTQAGARPVVLGPQVARASVAGALALAAIGALSARW
ncbi:hypothetical protein CATYP_07840 [Corynebacterium atypicum]|uniref:Ribosomal RNA small subunit methyltransferase E n=1 Tax=Corynebacterium atypicum TaxID=191610 RepID=A0ABM5QNZ6_9CORY|nr:16S rRNA (uracil(1498)-N(3))-methyltransferase [Corynebacterium atypicum]AIG64513.1 hypothetical protein CATYP_07840 [Corynebacterium atypicum]